MKERPRERARLRGLADREGIDVSNLYIAVTGADKGTQRRAVEALQAAGIEICRIAYSHHEVTEVTPA